MSVMLKRIGRFFSKPEVIFFSLFFLTGIYVYRDYGLSFDEDTSRIANGYVNYNFITSHQREALLYSNEKYHGPAFEIVLVALEKLFSITDTRSIYLMRHLCTFLLFFVSVIFFYRIAKEYFTSRNAALLSCLFFILSPRIFAESFFNSKDLAFLSVFSMCIYSLFYFLKRQSAGSAILHAFFCGFLIDIRIVGIIIPVLTLLLFFFDSILNLFSKQKIFLRSYSLGVFILFLIGFIVLFWPVLWIKPLRYFIEAFQEMGHYPWYGDILYLGKAIKPDMLPWHYIPVWIGITTPILYSILFIIGIIFIAGRALKNPLLFYRSQKDDLILAVCFFIPVISVIVFHSVVYDAWRHLFFIYPAFILISTKGFVSLMHYFSAKEYQWGKKIIYIAVALGLAFTLRGMIISHPYQNVYFNYLAGNPAGEFELDYWGLSYRQGLEYILEQDAADSIIIASSDYPGELNMQILPSEKRKRLRYTYSPEFTKYYLDNFRMNSDSVPKDEKIFSIETGNATILSVYQNTKHRRILRPVYKTENDFEENYSHWSSRQIFDAGSSAHSGKHVSVTNDTVQFSEEFSIPVDSVSDGKWPLLAKIVLWKYTIETDYFKAVVVLSIEDADNHDLLFYRPLKLNPQYEDATDAWRKVTFEVKLPSDIPRSKIIKVYVFNPGNTKLYIDDFSIEVSEICPAN
ncbi:MAG: glycosyltransferase family 39 protein [Bacteroidia bacterium]|nr:glycosyltransferase family 39 protein [Bacteroidia bacterium]